MSRVLACALALASRPALIIATAGCAYAGCGNADAVDSSAPLVIVGESTRYRAGDPLPRVTPWFDGQRVTLVAARGETIGLQIIRAPRTRANDVHVTLDGIAVRVFDVEDFEVTRPSTKGLYGGTQGKGRYADGLRSTLAEGTRTPHESTGSSAASSAASASSAPSVRSRAEVTLVELHISRAALVGTRSGELVVGDERFPIELAIADVTLPERAPRVWAYEDPRELAWAQQKGSDPISAHRAQQKGSDPISPSHTSPGTPSANERACAAMFRDYGVLLSPDLHLDWWPARRADFEGVRDVPVVISDDPAKAGDEVRAWIAATKGTGHVPFAIPIDEPRTKKRIQQVVELGKVIRGAGGGPHTFRFAVTADPRPEWLGFVDQFIQLRPAANSGAWTYNGIPPYSGGMVLDAETPGPRTWGWLMHRDGIAQWYVWDALYWHDRHNRKSTPMAERALDVARDPVSFDDGEDHGNLDGVLALPAADGCRPTLRLAALRRGQQDRALLELANACDPMATARVVARTMPRGGWPTDESVWEGSRRELVEIAACRRPR